MDNRDTVKEFIGGDSITFKTQLTPEQHNMMREWSLSIPTLFMLDICVVSVTKLNSEQLHKNPRKAKLVNYLRELDRPNNCFSYLFALLEKVSDSRGVDTDEELEEKILSDLASMRKFFNKARIYEPDEFVLGFLKELRGNPIEEKRSDYLGFLRVLNDQFKLCNPVSNKQRLKVAEEIVEQADQFDFSRQHPVVTIGLACLYGNPAAKKLMKFRADPNKFDAENVLADIMLITRFAGIKLEVEQLGREGRSGYIRSLFITDDNGLIDIIKCFTPKVVKHINKNDGRETHTTMTVQLKDLLTDIQIEDYDNLINLLESR
ncbi:TPA: hypothetical protein I7160_20910 [Vibrio vulnificus]|nr:hypothetical protein [Vibrio vulnificus]HAS6194746.1 hypothetical protein [Vibrio vulnificus]HAT8549490.1 hypothetical protein [Vibrio vulnificus]HDY7731479.1 hypothetical protein [Vibrio vulnificus]